VRAAIGGWLLSAWLLSAVAHAKLAPGFKLDTVQGKRVNLHAELKKGRVLLVCFWATWCQPCMEELRHLDRKLKAEPGIALDVLAVNVDTAETSSDVKSVVRQNGFAFPVALDPRHEVFAHYNEGRLLPYSVLVHASGEIAETFNGYDPLFFDKVKKHTQ